MWVGRGLVYIPVNHSRTLFWFTLMLFLEELLCGEEISLDNYRSLHILELRLIIHSKYLSLS